MKDRIMAAWSVLRGTHKAVPVKASWFLGNVVAAPYNQYSGAGASQVYITYGSNS